MTIADSRVVPYSPRIVQTFKEAIVAFRADPDGKWIKREDHESLLAEAESDRDKWRSDATEIANKCAIDIAALQSRLDAVVLAIEELAATPGNEVLVEEVKDALRAALGCATTGEGG